MSWLWVGEGVPVCNACVLIVKYLCCRNADAPIERNLGDLPDVEENKDGGKFVAFFANVTAAMEMP